MTADDDLDALYAVRPEDFTARRKELAAAAKKRGDTAAAKTIAAARRPTTAAWVVNVLMRSDGTARTRLTELNAQLRAAHAAMDGARIRELSSAQRALVHELSRAAFTAAQVGKPTAALQDDVTGTLQAAIADPDVAARLGRLAKAEEWSGFGDFGAAVPVASNARTAPTATKVKASEADRRRRAEAEAELHAASAAAEQAAAAVDDCRTAVATARRRYEKVLGTLAAAEREVEAAESEFDAAQRIAGEAKDRLTRAEGAVTDA